MAGDGRGGVLLDRNPFRGYKPPKEKNPLRVVLTEEEYGKLLEVSMDVDWRFRVALILAHETGHRIGAIRELRWSDIDLDAGLILWRAEHEKTGYEHVTPISDQAHLAFVEARQHCPGIGEAPVMPAPKDDSQPMDRYLVRKLWKRAEKLAGLEPKRGRGWHSLRRKFASDLKATPLKTLCQLGGWKSHMTVMICYQQVLVGPQELSCYHRTPRARAQL
jgi:integrase